MPPQCGVRDVSRRAKARVGTMLPPVLRATGLFAAITFTVLASLPACRAVVGIRNRTPALVGCNACVSNSCGAEVAACRADATCDARLACDEECDVGDDACHARC